MVIAALAPGHGGGILEGNDFIQGQHGCFRLPVHVVAFPGNQGRAKGSHNACDVWAYCLASRYFLKTPEHGVIVKRAALDHHMFPQVRGIGNLDYLKQGILNDGISQARGNVSHRGPFLLGLFYIRVHEYGTAGAQVCWVFGKQRLPGKIFH